MTAPPLLAIDDLAVQFESRQGLLQVLDGVSFSLAAGETLGVVGESGCGKSMTALAVMGLIPERGQIAGGSIKLNGEDLAHVGEKRLRNLRGDSMAMIFQEPMTSLNPVMSVGAQIVEAIRLHRNMTAQQGRDHAIAILRQVGIAEAERRFQAYPHELSGGMRQRVMIAIAMSCQPQLLIADEPTTALDVTVQAQILDLLRLLRADHNMGLLLITHDMGVIAEMADRVVVMYAGRIVEMAATEALLDDPIHPYTRGLIRCLPDLPANSKAGADPPSAPLPEIPGIIPPPHLLGPGCAFADRCPWAIDLCRNEKPVSYEVEPARWSACHRSRELRS